MKRDTCPLCGLEKISPFVKMDHRVIGKCRDCCFVFSQTYDEKELEKVYLESYYESAHDPRIQVWINRFQKTWRGLVEDLCLAKPAISSLIDIGAGTGGFLLSFYEASPKTKLFAIESSAQAREHLLTRIKDLQFPADTAEDLKKINQKFEAIVLLQCLEHVGEPLVVCQEIHRILHDDGVFFITVPNRFSIDGLFKNKSATRCYGNKTHLQFFSHATMMAMLKKAGFTNIKRINRFGGSEAAGIKAILQYFLRKLGCSSELRYIVKK